MLVKQLLARHGVTELLHPLYSQDLPTPDFFPFTKLKVTLKGRKFSDITHIQAVVTWELKAIPVKEFSRAFNDLYICCQRCIVYDGDYFEGLFNSFHVRPTQCNQKIWIYPALLEHPGYLNESRSNNSSTEAGVLTAYHQATVRRLSKRVRSITGEEIQSPSITILPEETSVRLLIRRPLIRELEGKGLLNIRLI
ncbi:hypothetical protein AVEN_6987-1 [Araneus ventricosus]|uniref:Histone-lysine N-methyltransferase SETMAR n=1 Tax=Araneus ventricosus TaxID=182803 RepID=A0A4Y2I4F2_ARAVE|nr:hypothetical protein AVEN_6987-1 [Araneus ventricosus]